MAKFKLDANDSPLFQKPEQKEEPVKEAAVVQEKKVRGRPRNDDLVRGSSVQEGLTADFTRATYLMKVDLVEGVKNYAYTERIDIKTAINKLVGLALAQEEKRLKKEGAGILDRKGGNSK